MSLEPGFACSAGAGNRVSLGIVLEALCRKQTLFYTGLLSLWRYGISELRLMGKTDAVRCAETASV